MSNKNIFLTVLFAFISFGSFTQITSAFADKYNCDECFWGIGFLGILATVSMLVFCKGQ